MHTYRKVTSEDYPDGAYEVGYFEPTDDGGESWYALKTYKFEMNAARFTSYLNGGTSELFVEDDEDA